MNRVPRVTTRRQFVTQASLAVVGTLVGTKYLSAESVLRSRLPATTWLPEPIGKDALRAMANAAIDAAHSAGAHYADVRVGYSQYLNIGAGAGIASPSDVVIMPQLMYGIRVCVDGAWAFAHGEVPSADAITTLAKNAVSTAHGYAKIHARLHLTPKGFAPAPVVTGDWETPYILDPFTVPIADQCALLSAYAEAIEKVPNCRSWCDFGWQQETRIFVSSDGTSCVQTFRYALPNISVEARFPVPDLPHIGKQVLGPRPGGYECVAIAGFQDEVTRQAEEMAKFVGLPQRPLDVGRYPVVMNGASLGNLFVHTLGRALESDRATGLELGASGMSYLSPSEEVFGTVVSSPILSILAHRKLPSMTAAKWDDEGVTTSEFPLIDNGTVVNYATSRNTAPDMGGGKPSHALSNGCAVAADAGSPVLVRLPHVSATPNSGRASLEDLYREMKHGVLLYASRYVSTNPSLSSGVIRQDATMFEVKNGKIAGFVKGNGLQFSTPRLWKSLSVLGDRSTVEDVLLSKGKGQPSKSVYHAASMPAAHFTEIDVVNTSVKI